MFRRKKEYLLYRLAIFHILPLIIFFSKKKDLWIASIISFVIMLTYLRYEFFVKRIFKIDISENYIQFYYCVYFKKEVAKYNLQEISYSYDFEAGGKGVMREELRFYMKQKQLFAGIGIELDGWTDKVVDLIIKKMEEYGIEKK